MIIDFNRININERVQMMGGDRINDSQKRKQERENEKERL